MTPADPRPAQTAPGSTDTLPVFDRAERQIPAAAVDAALAGVKTVPYWLDSADRPAPEAPLAKDTVADLLVVGGGYTGLWTALLAKEQDPARDVLLLEGSEIAWAASGRNGGFVSRSLTHGRPNGEVHVPDEVDRLDELGLENLEEIRDAIARHGIDCSFDWSGSMTVATEDRHVAELREGHAEDPENTVFFDADEIRGQIDSPLFKAGLYDRTESAYVDPARLAWGLKAACLKLGVRIHEHTPVHRLTKTGRGADARVLARTGGEVPGIPAGPSSSRHTVVARRVVLATNVFRSLLPATRLHTVPVYDYALMTEPLTDAQMDSLGWKDRQGLDDPDSRFHYVRLTKDRATGGTRILYGGYDAVYHYGGKVKDEYDVRPETFRRLAAHFLATFPQLQGVRFTHAWGGAIDTCSRFFAFFDVAHGGLTARAAGFTGLGVGATRFAARVLLDLVDGRDTELTRLKAVRRRPLPFPPDPIAWLGVEITKREMVRAEAKGRDTLWLKLTSALGMGFDS